MHRKNGYYGGVAGRSASVGWDWPQEIWLCLRATDWEQAFVVIDYSEPKTVVSKVVMYERELSILRHGSPRTTGFLVKRQEAYAVRVDEL
jgi:hypothetical protein